MIDWAAETLYWIERAKSYAIEAGISGAEVDLMDEISKGPLAAAKGPSIVELFFGKSAEEIGKMIRDDRGKTDSVVEDLITKYGHMDKIIELCCSNPNCPIRADIILHNQKLKASLN